MRAPDFAKLLTNAAANTTGSAVVLLGGTYMATCEGTSLDSTHTATVQVENSNKDWITVYAFQAAGVQTLYLPPGNYRGVTTASTPTAVYLELARVPGE